VKAEEQKTEKDVVLRTLGNRQVTPARNFVVLHGTCMCVCVCACVSKCVGAGLCVCKCMVLFLWMCVRFTNS
jgi:hypothetical protein